MAYELCKYQIQNEGYDKKQMTENLILFKMTGELTGEQYLELHRMVNPAVVSEEHTA